MRTGWVVLGCLAVVALMLMGTLAGCGEKPQTSDIVEVPTPETAPGVTPDEGGAGAPAADIPESAETLADVLGTFQIPSSFVMTVTTEGEEEAQRSGTMTVKMAGPQMARMRMEEEGDEGSEVMIMDFENKVMTSYNTTTNEGFQFPISDEEAADAPDPTEGYNPEFRVLGSETIDGVDCWIVEVTGEQGEGKMWIGKADGLMRKAEEAGGTQTMSYTDINEVPDSAFEVPAGVTLTDMSDIQMPESEGGE